MMSSPKPSKNNNDSSSDSNNNNATSSWSLQQQESPYRSYVRTLSPLRYKVSRPALSFVGPSSPLHVFKSPRISHHESRFTDKPQVIQSLGGLISQSANGCNSFGEDPGNSRKSNSQEPQPERFIPDTQKCFHSENFAKVQHYNPKLPIDGFLADPDHLYLADQDVEKSANTAETLLSDPTESKKNILKTGKNDGPGDKTESTPLPDNSNKVQHEKPAYGEPEKIDEGKNDVDWASEDPKKLESILAADASDERYIHDPHPQVTLNYRCISRRCLQFGEATSNALGSNKMKMVKASEAVTSFSSLCPQLQDSHNFPLTGPKSLDIGLHSNSIIKAIPTGQAATTDVKRSLLSSNVDGPLLVDTKYESHEINATVATDVGNSKLNEPLSPSKKKKKTSITTDNHGRKHCNCTKSKCLKLYCECFRAGYYCIDLCRCQDCTNRPEYAETITVTKQKIVSRNLDAFTPKIVQHTTDISSNNMEDNNLTTPSSARHKRGCNCQKSKCEKKYCECFQANVGCSSACRCEGCKNAYGKKEDYVAFEHTLGAERMSCSVEKGSNGTFQGELDMVAGNTAYDQPHHLSPITPPFQCSDQGKEGANSRVISGNYLPAHESDANMFASRANYTGYPENFHCSHALLETNKIAGFYDPQIECNNFMSLHHNPVFNRDQSGLLLSPAMNELRYIHQLPGSGSSHRWHGSPSSHTPSTTFGEAQCLHCPESRNGRKIILEGMPNFPSLSPCVDPKGNVNQDLGNTSSK